MESRRFGVEIGADLSGLDRGINRSVALLARFGQAAAQFGQQFAQSMANGTNAAIAAINRFATQSNNALNSFYDRQDRNRENFQRGWGRLATSMTSVGQRITVGVTAPLALLATQAFKTYGELDAMQRGLVAVMGSSIKAGQELIKLRAVAALPGLGMKEAVQGSVRLQAVGFAADQARKILLEFGNAIATTGGGKTELDQITVQLGQLAAKGTVLSQDLRPIIEAAPKVSSALQNIFGSIDPEEISTKLAVAGKDSKYFIDLLVNELSKLDRVTGGPKNAVENFSDAIAQSEATFMAAADQALNLTGRLDDLGNFALKAANSFAGLSPEAQSTTLALVGIAAATGPFLIAIGASIKLVRALTVETGALAMGINGVKAAFGLLLTPVGAVTVAITATVGALAVLGYSIQHYSQSLTEAVDKGRLYRQVQNQITEATAAEISKLNSLLSVARDETVSRKTRIQAIKDINAISPQYLGNISLETLNTQQATKAIFDYTNALTLKAKAQILSQRAAEASVKLDKIDRQPITDFVDNSRFSADQIAINIKTTASFNRQQDAAALWKDLGERRKKDAKKAAQDEVDYYNEQLQKAYVDASKKGIKLSDTPATQPVIDFKNLSGQSPIEQLKADVKAAKEAVESYVRVHGKGAKIPVQLQLDLKNKSQLLKDAKDAAKALMPSTSGSKVAVKAEVFGDEASLKRLESWLESRIQVAKGKGVEQEMQWLASVRKELEKVQALTSKDQPVSLPGLKEIVDPNLSKRVNEIVDNFHEIAKTTPGLFEKTGLGNFLADWQKGMPTLDYYQNKIEEIKVTIANLSLAGFASDSEPIKALIKLLQELKQAMYQATSASSSADAQTGQGADGGEWAKWVKRAEDRITAMKAKGQQVKQSAEEMAGYMKAARESLAGQAASVLEAVGEGIAKGENPLKVALKAVLGMLGDFMIKIGTAMVVGGSLLSAAETAFPFLAPLLNINGPAGVIAGGALIVGGGAVKGFAGDFEGGALFTGESFIRVGESPKARAGGGEFVAPVDKGARLIARQLVGMGAVGTMAAGATSDRASLQSQLVNLNVSLDGAVRGSDILFSLRNTIQSNMKFGNTTANNLKDGSFWLK